MKRKTILLMLSLLCSWTGSVGAVSTAAALDGVESVSQVLTELEQKMSVIHTLKTSFLQEKELKVFHSKVRLEGAIYMEKPMRFAWHGKTPIRYSLVLDEEKIEQWDEDSDQVQTFSAAKNPVLKIVIDQMQKWFYGDYLSMLDQYTAQVWFDQPLVLTFAPKAGTVAFGVIERVTVTFEPDKRYIRSVHVEEKNGDNSLITFSNTVLNERVDKRMWEVGA